METSLGWIALIHGIENGHWITPAEATAITGVRGRRLGVWAEQGVISSAYREPGEHHRYLGEELVVAVGVARGGRPTLALLKWHIRDQLRVLSSSS